MGRKELRVDEVAALARFRELFPSFDHLTVENGQYVWLHEALKSEPYRDIYVEHLTEPIDLILAGPLYAIAADGHCDYMFEEGQFARLKNAEDFLNRYLDFAKHYRKHVMEMQPQSQVERDDYNNLMAQAAIVEELGQLGYSVIRERPATKGSNRGRAETF